MELLLPILAISIIGFVKFYDNKRLVEKRKFIIRDTRFWNLYLIIATLWLVLGIFNLKSFISYFQDAYRLLVPHYFESIYTMFNSDKLNSLLNQFNENGLSNEYLTLIMYITQKSELYTGILYLFISILNFDLGLRKNYIYDDGIHSTKGNYNWAEIKYFRWEDKENLSTYDEVEQKYFDLYFIVDNSKLFKFFGADTKEIHFKLSKDSRQKVNLILSEKLQELKDA